MYRTLSLFPRLLFLVVIVFIFASPAHSAGMELQVRVFELSSTGVLQPIEGARVCLGSENNLAAWGGLEADSTGTVTFKDLLVAADYRVTVSAAGFQGMQRTATVNAITVTADFAMERCTGTDCGPTCGGSGAGTKSISVAVLKWSWTAPFERIAGAKVCVGTYMDYGQYGVVATGPAGEDAIISGIPSWLPSVRVTVRRETKSVDVSGVGDNGTASAQVVLTGGTGDPPLCRIKLPFEPQPAPLIKINNFEINRGNEWTDEREVGLFATLEGAMPTQYQVSESQDFLGAQWLNFSPVSNPANNPFATYNFDRNQFHLTGPITDPSNINRLPPGSIRQPVTPGTKPKYGNRTLPNV